MKFYFSDKKRSEGAVRVVVSDNYEKDFVMEATKEWMKELQSSLEDILELGWEFYYGGELQ